MPARSIGTATISFGLVSIPTKLYTTNESSGDISFNMLHDADNARFNYLDGDSDLIADSDGIADGSGEYQHGPSLA